MQDYKVTILTSDALHKVNNPNVFRDKVIYSALKKKVLKELVGIQFFYENAAPPCIIVLTKHSPKQTDDDNLISSFKLLRDIVAEELGLSDDSDSGLLFVYKQKRVFGSKFITVTTAKATEDRIKELVLDYETKVRMILC